MMKFSVRSKSIISLLLLNLVVTTMPAFAASTWTVQSGSPSNNWSGIGTSSDGSVLAAARRGSYVYVSTDAGITWGEKTGSGSRQWGDIAVNGDGTKMVAVDQGIPGFIPSYIHTSTDGGNTWVASTRSNSSEWTAVAISSDGTKMVAARREGDLYTSSNSGATWTLRSSTGSRNWTDLAMSADGSKIVAAPINGFLYSSTDGGATWNALTSAGSDRWNGASISADGTTIAAVPQSNKIYVSTNSGTTWNIVTTTAVAFYSITISADGTRMAAADASGSIWTSSDTGATWTRESGSGTGGFYRVVSSDDGTRLAATPGPLGGKLVTGVISFPAPPNNSPTVQISVPDPVQQSVVGSVTPTVLKANSSATIKVEGTFNEKVINIAVNGANLPAESWTQTSTSLTVNVAATDAPVLSVVIYNGAVPVLRLPVISVAPASNVVTNVVSVKQRKSYIFCGSPGSATRIIRGIDPVCPAGYLKK